MKINLMKITEFSVKKVIKEHKKTGTKKTNRRKKGKISFSPGKNPVYFLCSIEKKLTCDQKSRKSDFTQVTA